MSAIVDGIVSLTVFFGVLLLYFAIFAWLAVLPTIGLLWAIGVLS